MVITAAQAVAVEETGTATDESPTGQSPRWPQIVQTWLETWATARAIPQQTTPGIPVIFNHTWSHVLDPTTHIKMYMWDVNVRTPMAALVGDVQLQCSGQYLQGA